MSPTVGLHSSQQRWIPSSKLQRDVNSSHDRTETIFRTVRSILNKLTPENFNKLCLEILNVGITSKVVLKGIVILIFDKSIDEPRYSTLYANLCYRLYHEAPNFDPPPAQPIKQPHGSTLRPNTFRRLLIAKLQDEFENRNRKLEAFDSKVGPLDADEEEQRTISKHHMLGNIKFIGELYRLDILQESIMHKCIKQLINKKKKGTIADMAEDLECLSQIMTTCGKKLDHQKAKSLMDQYFERMEVLRRKHADLPSRIRFMLQDVIELRRNHWVPRRVNRDTGPKTLEKIRQEVMDIYPTLNINGDQYNDDPYKGSASRATIPGYGGGRGYQMPNYGAERGGHFPQSPQYSGTFHGTSPPKPRPAPGDKGGSDFDFFGAVNTRPSRPAAPMDKPLPNNSMAPPRPAYMADPMRFIPPGHPQRYPVYNGYGQPPMQRPPPPAMGGFPPADPMMAAPSHQQRQARASGQQTQKAEQKPGKEIPPRFQRQKQQQQKVDTAGYRQNAPQNKEADAPPAYASATGAPLRNGGSVGPRKTPVFTSMNSSSEPPRQAPRQSAAAPYTKPQPSYTEGTPLGTTRALKPPASANARSPRSHPANAPISLRPASSPRHPSPTIRETNVDAIQPPFQQAIDNAQQQVSLGKKSGLGSQEKAKVKKSTPSKADVEKLSAELLEKFFSRIKNSEQIGRALTDAKVQKKHLSIFVGKAVIKSLSKSDEDQEKICRLFGHLVVAKVCTKDHVVEGIQFLFDKLAELEEEIPKVKSLTSSLLARLIISEVLNLADVGEHLSGGSHFPLFLLTLQQMTKVKSEEWMSEAFKASKVEMMNMLPEASQSKASMIAILEGKQLQFLFPLVHMESKLANQIEQDCSPVAVYKWIKENVTSDLHSDPGFINVLVACCLDHVTKGSSLAKGVEPGEKPSREIKEKERQLLANIKPVLQKFVHEKPKLQLHALYASQVFCFNKDFPKGLLLRLFNAMYEEDIVDEETYFIWKEDVNDMYPGKGKALFQVNAWLTWLHEAETEDDDADD